MLLSGDPISAVDAERIGLVNRVVAAERLAAESLALAQSLAPNGQREPCGPSSGWSTAPAPRRRRADHDRALDANVEIIQTADAREGFAAFFEKRPPRFQHG